MVDHISSDGRSRIMRAIRSSNTKPELKIRKLLHENGYRYRLHRSDLPGKPDIVFPGRKKVIFVHGCFWHQHKNKSCKNSQKPKTNESYWIPKLKRNQERDIIIKTKLKNLGWKVFVVWECEIIESRKLFKKIKIFLNN